jgi:nitrite reductase (NADH) small subunit
MTVQLDSTPSATHRMTPQDLDWIDVCALADIVPGTGVAVLLGATQIAVLRTRSGDGLYAISNYDPFSNAFVLARGIVGDRAGTPKVASPMYKQSFALETGECLDDPRVRLPVYPVRVSAGRVQLGAEPRS